MKSFKSSRKKSTVANDSSHLESWESNKKNFNNPFEDFKEELEKRSNSSLDDSESQLGEKIKKEAYNVIEEDDQVIRVTIGASYKMLINIFRYRLSLRNKGKSLSVREVIEGAIKMYIERHDPDLFKEVSIKS